MITVNYGILHARADGSQIPWNLMVNQLVYTARWAYEKQEAPTKTREDILKMSKELKTSLARWEMGSGQAPVQHLVLAYTMTYGVGDEFRMTLHQKFPIVDDETQVFLAAPTPISEIDNYVFDTAVDALEEIQEAEDEVPVQAQYTLPSYSEEPRQPYAVMTTKNYQVTSYENQGPDEDETMTWETPSGNVHDFQSTYPETQGYAQGGMPQPYSWVHNEGYTVPPTPTVPTGQIPSMTSVRTDEVWKALLEESKATRS
ncbi:hypothetical protein M231_02411 [Tremella mesenterica]|uniref:Uncharacterized protein n=1 Tax=Tremella mesenterica TaxID=5217 RepID=A0A4V1M4G6_TREME|nr:hypothetical protein M231_02411 [Tremella mesenterica]